MRFYAEITHSQSRRARIKILRGVRLGFLGNGGHDPNFRIGDRVPHFRSCERIDFTEGGIVTEIGVKKGYTIPIWIPLFEKEGGGEIL